ncbi:transcription-repair coupling factor [Anaplasma phagocytophilum]|uniref:Transcription-repair-coupling factor n=1 Tax=Anaplasma phagocytophilum str. ApNP TaxID=1359153 RepID=A0A0F3NIU5_ANAPH|nr:transcription-repair coupling factor [Anaplasma phagocytophilum str. ApNP]
MDMGSSEIVTGIAPELEDALITEICRNNPKKSFVCVLQDDKPLELLVKTLKFFDSTHNILLFPAWDTCTYKHTSPSSYVMTHRVKCLLDLLSVGSKPYILLTTISALIQKVLPKNAVSSSTLHIEAGKSLSMDELTLHLIEHGYVKSSTVVQEVGSFAVRGDIVDIFQAVNENPVRIYFDYDIVESIKFFDPDTQITCSEQILDIVIFSASELIKNDENIARFSEKCSHLQSNNPPLYEAVVHRQKFEGEEQLLPLLQADALVTLFDYIQEAELVLSEATFSNIKQRIENIWEQNDTQDCTTHCTSLFLDLQSYEQVLARFHKILLCRFDSAPQSIVQNPATVALSKSSLALLPDLKLQARERGCNIFSVTANHMQEAKKQVLLACYSEESMQYLVEKFKHFDMHISRVSSFSDITSKYSTAILPFQHDVETEDFIIITEHSLLGRQCSIKKARRTVTNNASELTIGDVVVHKDYGVGIFIALRTLTVCGSCHDFVEIKYRNDDKLFVPVEDTDLITKYGINTDAVLDRLGSSAWHEKQNKLKKRIDDIAKTLLHAEAMRKLADGSRFLPSSLYIDFCKECPYVETEDQLKAIADVENDLASGKVMDRLICGDVGFGKTEIALRAAFLVVNEDITCQVAVLVPTTLLCRQHFLAFQERFKNYKVNIQQLSKATAKKKQQIREGLEEGSINIIIGTSALLSDSIQFLDLRLLIIDEEQHFGVQQKEKLRLLKHDVHVLSLSATPIPRTLHMSLSNIKDLSILRTPPIGRTTVEISIIHFDEKTIKTAILHEVNRGGRVFFTCPLIADIEPVLTRLQKLVPEVKIAVAHGGTAPLALDKIMNDFFDGKFSLLLTTSIIESGIDIPFANTIIIYNADMFGLAQLYQLKGRVGRSTTQGYAYLILSNKATSNSPGMKRLEALKSLNSVGSGFALSLQDMDMRGFGNLVGEEQSGNIKEVGIELYHRMLEEALETCKMTTESSAASYHNIKVDINANVRIPESYIQELELRMQVYKKISSLKTPEEISRYSEELKDRFGMPPREVINLLDIIHIKHLCARIGIAEITHFKNHLTLLFGRSFTPQESLLKYFVNNAGIFTMQGNSVNVLISAVHANNVTRYLIACLRKINSLLTHTPVSKETKTD